MLLEEFGRPVPDGAGSFREVMEREMASLTLPLDEAVAWLVERARLRRGFHELAREHRPLIVSSSFEETILEHEGVELEVVANRVDARPDGWRVLWRDPGSCPECGDVCKRSALPEPFRESLTTALDANELASHDPPIMLRARQVRQMTEAAKSR